MRVISRRSDILGIHLLKTSFMDCLDSEGYMEDSEGNSCTEVGHCGDTLADHCRYDAAWFVFHPDVRECDKTARAFDCCTDYFHCCVLVDRWFG